MYPRMKSNTFFTDYTLDTLEKAQGVVIEAFAIVSKSF